MKNTSKVHFALILCLTCTVVPYLSSGQDSTSLYDKFINLPDKFFGGVNRKSEKFQQDLLKSTELYLKKLSKQELKLQRELAKKDPLAARTLFGDVTGRYDSLRNILNRPTSKMQSVYSHHLDSIQTALLFFNKNNVLGKSPDMQAKLQSVFKDYGNVQGALNQTNFVHEQLRQRQQMLKQKLQNFGLAKEFKKYQEKIYYYRAQVDEYKKAFETPGKVEATLLKIANKFPAFSKFFNRHSQLASLFRLPGNEDATLNATEGMQTRAMLTRELEQRMGNGSRAEGYLSQSIGNARASLDNVKGKLNQLGNSGGEIEMPDFKPNQEKSKSFLNRLELGTNIQSNKNNGLLPVSTDFGISIGYKLSQKTIFGVGSSYKIGWGRGFRHLAISHEGVGLRSFYEMKLKGSFWVSGGAEMNYRSAFNRVEELKNHDAWQRSILTGISKKFQLSNKLKGHVQVLYDFLHATQLPRTQPLVFRVGYAIK